MKWPVLLYSVLAVFILSCASPKTENWWHKPQNEWPQILLSNSIEFKNRPSVSGASAFLLYHNNDTVICTARHLVEKPIGIIPSVPQDSVNTLLKDWKLFPRATPDFDSIKITKLRNTSSSPLDFLVLEAETKSTSITALKPALDSAHENDVIYILGCERSDIACTQNVYKTKVRWVVDSQIIVEPESKFKAAGFSGAPAINENGEAIGIATAVYNEQGEFYLYLESIHQVIPYLK
ncbi:trypsin-like peptidase domain-containing protein [Owenweeksia hongkongensis]|uniref:trypsin-like peptidase domain-containing protein n=1 Tax=Owenweeksia hongkongensis TaxID=253245 RepID=UPI003A8E2806